VTDASIIAEGDRPAIRLERRLEDPPPIVWHAFTHREELREWFPCDVIIEGGAWEVGASINFPFPADVIDMTLTGVVLELDEPRYLAFTWGEETLRFRLTPDGGGTLLELVDELPASAAARNAAGWDQCLNRLAGVEVPGRWQPDSRHTPPHLPERSDPKMGRRPTTSWTRTRIAGPGRPPLRPDFRSRAGHQCIQRGRGGVRVPDCQDGVWKSRN
jgi:uncharacterized protein YndB with AHSA1/START domain